jgi:tRNA/tmRNA/rRNA uracil-C5-methylase (TrmA/RlmC/RlmD family)
VFVEGALPGETVTIETVKRKPTYEIARVRDVLKASAARVDPACAHFGICGGCTMQHFEATAQVAAKQRALEDTLWHIGRVRAECILPAIYGPAWGYRHRARLSVRNVPKKGGVLVGFHERKSSYVADMLSCEVLPPKVSRCCPDLRELIGALSIRDRIAADRACCRRGWNDHGRARRRRAAPCVSCCASWSRSRPATRIACARSPTSTASSSTCSRVVRRPRCRFIHRRRSSCTRCRSLGCNSHLSPTEFTQVNASINPRAGAPRTRAARSAAR